MSKVQDLLDGLDDTVADLITTVFAEGRKFEEQKRQEWLRRVQTMNENKQAVYFEGAERENREIRLAIAARCESSHSALDGCQCYEFIDFIRSLDEVPNLR